MTELASLASPAYQQRDVKTLYDTARRISGELLRGGNRSWSRTDLAHEAFARVLGGGWASRLWDRPDETMRALRTIVRRTLVDYDRSRSKLRAPGGGGRHRVDWDDAVDVGAGGDRLDAAVEYARLLERIHDGVSGLTLARPAAVVEVAELALLLGLTQREIAAHTGIPQTTVSSWLRMIRAWACSESRR